MATAVEWEIRYAVEANPIGVVRRFDFGDPRSPDTWFRAVTWAHASEARQLICYTRTPERAAQAVWDSFCERNSSVSPDSQSPPRDNDQTLEEPRHSAPEYLERRG